MVGSSPIFHGWDSSNFKVGIFFNFFFTAKTLFCHSQNDTRHPLLILISLELVLVRDLYTIAVCVVTCCVSYSYYCENDTSNINLATVKIEHGKSDPWKMGHSSFVIE